MTENERAGPAAGSVRTVSVSGKGEVELEPTIGHIVLGANVVRRTADDALDDVAQLVEQLSEGIVGLGIDKSDITTSRFAIRAEYDHSQPGRGNHPIGFRASYTVHVLVREIDRTGEVVGAAVNAGANTIENVWFLAENYDEARNRARELAFEDARGKADQLANLAGARLGQVLRIDDGTSAPVGRYAQMSSDALYSTRELSAKAPSFNPEDLTVKVDLSVVWALE